MATIREHYLRALNMATLSALTMQEPDEIARIIKEQGGELKGWFDHAENGTQAALYDVGGELALVFRATQVDRRRPLETLKDFRTDLMFRKARWKTACVHRGFLDRYLSIAPQLRSARPLFRQRPVFIAGHSLGGALAKMAAIDIPAPLIREVYTFGAPRVGNSPIDALVGVPLYQFIHRGDLVPRTPLLMMGYRRAGDKRYITGGGQIVRSPASLRLVGRFLFTLATCPPCVLRDHSIVHYISALERASAVSETSPPP